MVKSILSSPQELVLERALSGAALRHKVISNNIANVNTPGFKRSDVSFEETLTEAMREPRPALSKTHPLHFSGLQTGIFSPLIATDNSTSMRTDENNVDIDVEMANLAKNNIYYDAAAQQLSKYYANLLSAIKGS